MAVLRFALVGCIVLAVATAGLAREEKTRIDKAKLLGTWTFVKTDSKNGPPPEGKMKVEFTKAGKVTVTMSLNDKTLKLNGTYSVKGDKMTTVLKYPGGKEKTDSVTIKTLTAKKFVTTEDEDGKTVTTEFKK